MSKAAVLGAGSWGTALAKVMAEAGTEVTMWARRKEVADRINATHENGDYLPGIALPESIRATDRHEEAMEEQTSSFWRSRRSRCGGTSSSGRIR